jgi:hypothetical protein
MQVVDRFDQLRLGRVLLARQRRAQCRRPLLVDPGGRQVGDGDLDPGPQLGEVTQRHAATGQIDRRDLGDRMRALRHDEEPAAGSPAHAGNLVVLEQAHRLAEQRTADPLACNEL